MLQQQGRRSARPASSRLTVSLAKSRADVREAQRLRYAVFGDELGARLHGPEPGVDEDRFDAHAHHLLVRDESGAKRSRERVAHLLKRVEVLIWQHDVCLADGRGMAAINKLRDLGAKGVGCMMQLRNIELL